MSGELWISSVFSNRSVHWKQLFVLLDDFPGALHGIGAINAQIWTKYVPRLYLAHNVTDLHGAPVNLLIDSVSVPK
jgi:hypothetical protein